MVVGEAGVGKTRLLSEAAAAARDRGVMVGDSRCLPLTTSLPFDPVLDLLRGLGDPVRLPAGRSPRELFGEVLSRLERRSVAGALLLCVDDLQWCDAGTLELVHYCLARLSDLPIGWLLTARPAPESGLLAHRLARAGLIERIELEPLSFSETRLLADGMLGAGHVGEELVEVLHGRTGGNPFLCEELLRALPTGGRGRAVEPSFALAQLVPSGVMESVRERSERLSRALRSALEWAAVLPAPFSYEELDAVAGPGVGTAPEALADAGFLVGDGDRGWIFTHSLLRDAVYRRLPEHERVIRHGVVADALIAGPTERLAPQLAEARRWLEAAEAYLELADAALDRGQGEDALRLYDLADELALNATVADHRVLGRAQGGRVLALLRSGDGSAARSEATILLARLGAGDGEAESLYFMCRYAAALIVSLGDVEGARRVIVESAPLIERARGAALAEALAVRAHVSVMSGDPARAILDAERAVELAESQGDVLPRVTALGALGLAVGQARSAADGIRILESAAELASAASLQAEEARLRLNLSYLAGSAGDLAAKEKHIRLGLALDGAPASLTAFIHGNQSHSLAHHGNLDGALAHGLAALRLAARAGPSIEARVAIAITYVRIWRGELAAARRLLDAYGDAAASVHDWRVAELWGMLLEAEGSPADALARYQQGAADDPIPIGCLAGIARTAAAIDDVDTARRAVARLEQLSGRWAATEWLLPEARGWLAAGGGHAEEAAAHLLNAADACPEENAVARLRFEAARLSNDREGLLAAIGSFERIGAYRDADRARAIARQLGMRPGRRHKRSGVLSVREQEVAQLVAAGQTNAEVAAALFLSPRTVERHVGNILTKLGDRSRVQIAARAAAGKLPGVDLPQEDSSSELTSTGRHLSAEPASSQVV